MKLTEVEHTDEISNRHTVEDLFDIQDSESKESTRKARLYRILDVYVLATLRILGNDWRSVFGIAVLVFYLFMATIWAQMYDTVYRNQAPQLISPFDSSYTHEVYGIPIWEYPLGTDGFGQPILKVIVNAAPAMWRMIIAAGVVTIVAAVVIGVTAGYKGGLVDDVLMLINDIVMALPGLPVTILLVAIFEPSDPAVIAVILAIDNWPNLARALRSQVLAIRNESYVEAARLMDVSTGKILWRDVTPQIMPYVLINAATASKNVIIQATGLYFLGILPPTDPNWGLMMDEAFQYGAVTNLDIFYWILFPMMTLASIAFALVLLSQGLDRVFNPRLRARYSKTVSEDELDL